jgi:hypothetical protein
MVVTTRKAIILLNIVDVGDSLKEKELKEGRGEGEREVGSPVRKN